MKELNDDEVSFLTQAATAARYNAESYRGTFTLSATILKYLTENYGGGARAIVEGACATGECLSEITGTLNSDFYLGLDISGSLVRQAQEKAIENTLFVQGNICSLPLRENSADIYLLNNVFDRVVDPPEACRQADSILNGQQSFLILSNCDPLQFTYETESGDEINFVPKKKQLSLERGLKSSGFQKVLEERGVWQINTIAYGNESLPYKSLVGRRLKK